LQGQLSLCIEDSNVRRGVPPSSIKQLRKKLYFEEKRGRHSLYHRLPIGAKIRLKIVR
jgi:hypothetical protein